jgi:methionyl-tRNA formyltransferase
LAKKYDLKIEQPTDLKKTTLDLSDVDINIVVQYGKLIPKNIIETPKYQTINIHTSLLPKYRGASPIQSAIIAGEKNTGVTIMKMDEGLDSGPIICQKSIEILPTETYLELEVRLIKLSMSALDECLIPYIKEEIKTIIQAESEATFCHRLTRTDGKINWNSKSTEIYNQYRGLTPWPGIWTSLDNKRLKLLDILPADEKIAPGTLVFSDNKIYIGCLAGSIEVNKIQIEGKNPMSAEVFISGYRSLNKKKLN